MGFADSMRTFTEEVRQGAQARATALAAVTESTDKLLGEARGFLQRVSQEHKERAQHVNSTLASNRQGRQEQVRAFRKDLHEQLGKLRHELRERLNQTRNERHEKLAQLTKAFATARAELATDLREAGRLWRTGREEPPASPKRQRGHASPKHQRGDASPKHQRGDTSPKHQRGEGEE